MRSAPGILSVEREPLNVLRKAAVAAWSEVASRAIRWNTGSALRAEVESAWILRVNVRVACILDESLIRRRKRATEHRFMNEVNSELERMIAGSPAEVVAHLVLVLIAQVRKKSDRSGKLVVAKGFEAGNGQGSRAEWKRQRKTKIRIARLGEVQQAGIENQSAEPGRTESVSIADRKSTRLNSSHFPYTTLFRSNGNASAKPRFELRVWVRCNRLASRTKVPSQVELKA